jgi:toxin ParE1/3/4
MALVIAPRARDDIASILAWTQQNFGPPMVRRYAQLIAIALSQVEANPELAGSEPRSEIADSCRTYHLFFSRKAAGQAGGRVRRPRHFLLYRLTETGTVEVGRVLHDSMDWEAHMPEEYRRSAE